MLFFYVIYFVVLFSCSNPELRTLPPELGNLRDCWQLRLNKLNLSGIPKHVRPGKWPWRWPGPLERRWEKDEVTLRLLNFLYSFFLSPVLCLWALIHKCRLSPLFSGEIGVRPKDTLAYLRATLRKSVPYYRMKLMVVGLQVRSTFPLSYELLWPRFWV